jgi:SAM-dependent methyltransferase
MTLPSEFDNIYFPVSRAFINETRLEFINRYLQPDDVICDIGNQGKNIPELQGRKLVTLDITPDTGPDIVADITRHNAHIPDGHFDALLCTEVLEHVVEPFAAVRELKRIVKVGGYVLITTPLNCRIHGPVPDCWRFTEFGLKVLLRDFEIVLFRKLDTPDRNLFPLEYGVIVKRVSESLVESDPREMTFQKVD